MAASNRHSSTCVTPWFQTLPRRTVSALNSLINDRRFLPGYFFAIDHPWRAFSPIQMPTKLGLAHPDRLTWLRLVKLIKHFGGLP
jgi:hypothetical protein